MSLNSRKKKQPSDYPIFGFRVDSKIKQELEMAIGRVQKKLNKIKDPQDRLYRKNDVIVEALRAGLASLSKRHR